MTWIANEAYIMEETGTICVISGRTFKKVNPGKTLIAYYYEGGYTGPLLVSTDPEAVKYNAGPTFGYTSMVKYLGITWYVSDTAYFMGGNVSSSSGPALKLEGAFSSNTEGAMALFEATNVRLPEQAKYLLRIDGIFYDNELNIIQTEELTEAVMQEYGSNELTLDLSGYNTVEVFKNDTSEYREPLRITRTAMPRPQAVQTNEVDISNETITGIESVTVEAEGSPAFALSFDSGATWLMHNDTAWVVLSEDQTGMQAETLEAVTPEQWQEQIAGIQSFLFRFTLADPADAVTRVVFDFTN